MGVAIFVVQQLLAIVCARLPNLPGLADVLPRGTFKLLVTLVVGAYLSSSWRTRRVEEPHDLLQLSFAVWHSQGSDSPSSAPSGGTTYGP